MFIHGVLLSIITRSTALVIVKENAVVGVEVLDHPKYVDKSGILPLIINITLIQIKNGHAGFKPQFRRGTSR